MKTRKNALEVQEMPAGRECVPAEGQGAVCDSEDGSTTVEYAIGVVVAATFAGLLLAIVRSDAVRQGLEGIVQQALNVV